MEDVKVRKGWFIQSGQGTVEENYEYDDRKELGAGTYGRVIKAVHKITKAIRAIKIIPKAKVKNHERFATEINILKNLVGLILTLGSP
jgi:calcium-dependent protein kinase